MITPRVHPDYVRSARLGKEITELCAYLYAATYRLLVMIHDSIATACGNRKASTPARTGSIGSAASA